MDNQITVAQRNRAIKKALSEVYNRENVTVKGHTGTAYGWMTIKVTVSKPIHEHNQERYGHCSICHELQTLEEKKITEIVHETVKKIGSYIGTYSSDDGYGSTYENMHVEARIV